MFIINANIVKYSPPPITSVHQTTLLLLTNTKIINQYRKTYTLYSGLNNVNYLNIIKRDHVSATVRTRLHLASGWSRPFRSLVQLRSESSESASQTDNPFYNIPPITTLCMSWNGDSDLTICFSSSAAAIS